MFLINFQFNFGNCTTLWRLHNYGSNNYDGPNDSLEPSPEMQDGDAMLLYVTTSGRFEWLTLQIIPKREITGYLYYSDSSATPKLQQLYQDQYHVSNLNVEFCRCGKDNVLYIYMLCVSIRVLNVSLI